MKIIRLVTVVMLSVALTACGSKKTVSPAAAEGTTMQAVEKEEMAVVEMEDVVKPAETAEGKRTTAEEGKTETSTQSQTGQKTEDVYEDNFAVKTSEAEAFAEKIKTAVAAKDMEALADLTAFPVYVGIAEGGVENREALIALERV